MKTLTFLLLFFCSFNLLYAQNTIHVPGDQPTIQAGIDVASDGDLVLVADGNYIENINFNGKKITVASHFILDEDTLHIVNTVIDGSQPSNPDSGSVVVFNNGEDTSSVLCGFTVTGGTGTPNVNYKVGGGIIIMYSSPRIKNNIIEYNQVVNVGNTAGSAIHITLASDETSIIENNIIRYNLSESSGLDTYVHGAINIARRSSGIIIIRNNIVTYNTLIGYLWANGGAIAGWGYNNENFVLIIENNKISSNMVVPNSFTCQGGAIILQNISTIIRNNIIAYNSAYSFGGILSLNTITPAPVMTIIQNNTIFGNTANLCGALSTEQGIKILNCTIWNNSSPQFYGTDATITFSNLEESYANGSQNISADPEFRDTLDFLLSGTSPCIDNGNPDASFNDVEDPNNPGNPLWPALGSLRNDIGHCGGPNSLWWANTWPTIITSVENNLIDGFIPEHFNLSQNYPNPFNPSTKIRYTVPQITKIEIGVFDVLGNKIETLVNEEKPSGTYEVTWNAESLPSGVYFYRIMADSYIETKKMLLLK